ncbi:MAG: hypothetical protein HDR25_00565 [Lachnospiraceae bacterium]|nr:hypothetical protein [Lachnospiraceae bacterium]
MRFYEYAKQKYHLWLTVFLIALCSHGTMMFSNSVGIDTEDIITLKDLFYNGWLSVGRQGLVLLKALLGTKVFNPYLAGAASLFFITMTCFLWTYLFSYISQKDNLAAELLFSVLLIVSPLMTEQFYFKLQSMEVTAGFCLTAVSLFLLYRAAEFDCGRERYALTIGSALLNLVLFSLYQVMLALFIFGAAACFFLHYFVRENRERSILMRFAVLSPVVFLVSFIGNQVITAIWFGTGMTYLTTQSAWFSLPLRDCLLRILNHTGRIAISWGLHYTKFYPIGCLLLVILVICLVKKRADNKGLFLGIFSLLMVMGGPLYMTVICAGEPVLRSQLVMPFALGFLAYVLILLAGHNRRLMYALIVLCIIAGYGQLNVTLRLNYTDMVRYESDVRIAASIMEEINKLEDDTHSYPVIFIGKHHAELNNSCVQGELIGYSFFEWDTDIEPYSFFSTRRILGFLHTLGGNYAQGNEQQFGEAIAYSQGMNNWPMRGSIKLHDGYIIVKLSD